MLVNTKEMLEKASKNFYAVGAFNVSNLEMVQAIVAAAEEEHSPVIVQVSEKAIYYAGLEQIAGIVKTAAKNAGVPVALHLDHGTNLDTIKKCIKAGFTSLMIDASHRPFDENTKLTRQVVALAKKQKISVEAELGTIGGVEDNIKSKGIILTEPKDALRFVKLTKIDSLAVAVGTSHGAYKFDGKAQLSHERIKEIKELVRMPLVLHGASGAPDWIIQKAKRYGTKLGNVRGVPNTEIRLAINHGINKINIDTDNRLAFAAALREFLATKRESFDPREIMGYVKDIIKQDTKDKMRLFDCSGKA